MIIHRNKKDNSITNILLFLEEVALTIAICLTQSLSSTGAICSVPEHPRPPK